LRSQPDAPDPECNCYLGGLPPHWNEEAVRANCIPFGEIRSIRIMRDKDTQMSKCYGFVTFARRESAQLAIQNLNQLAVEGKFLQMRLANVKAPDGSCTVNPNIHRMQAAPWQQQGYHQGGYQQPHGGHVFRPPQFAPPPQNYGGYPQQQAYGMPAHGGYDGGGWHQQQQQQQQQYWGGQQQQHQGYGGGGYEEPPPPPPPEDQ
jgi:RNA recognition motif-containing protein